MSSMCDDDIYQRLYWQFFGSSSDERIPLTAEELELAAFVHPIVTEALKTHLGNEWKRDLDMDADTCYKTQDFREKVQLTRSNLKLIIQTFSESETVCKKFVKEYPPYAGKRAGSISHLRDLATSINTDRQNCNISQVTGSSVGALGGVAILASIFFPPAGAVLAIGGGIAAGLGGAVSIGTTIAESELVKKKTAEATMILEKDGEDFQVFAKWFAHSIQFEEAAEAVLLGIDVLRRIGLKLRGLNKSERNFKIYLESRIKEFMKEVCKKKKIESKTAPILSISITTLCILFLRTNPMFIEAVEKTSQQLWRFATTMKLTVALVKGNFKQILAVGGKETAVQTTRLMGKAVKGIFAGLAIALDVMEIVSSSLDLSAGSKSAYAEQITKAADELQKELDLLKDVYNDIKGI